MCYGSFENRNSYCAIGYCGVHKDIEQPMGHSSTVVKASIERRPTVWLWLMSFTCIVAKIKVSTYLSTSKVQRE